MINAARDYYKTYLKSMTGKFVKLEDLEVDFTFVAIKNWQSTIAHSLSLSKAVDFYYGIKITGDGANAVKNVLVTVTTHNELKSKGALINLTEENTKDKDVFNDAANEAIESHIKDVKNATKNVALEVHDANILMLPFDVNINDYQNVIRKIKELDFNIYHEEVYLKIN